MRQGRFTDAIQAYARAIELLGENRDRLRGFAEAHLNAGGGVVNQEARAAFRKILATEPELVAPRFWLAVGLEQDGDRAAAERAYRSLLQERDGNQPELAPRVRAMIEQRLAAVTGAASSGNQVGEPRPVPDADAGKAPALPGNTATVPASEQAELIEGMVSGLAARLANGGGSVEEWQRLMRAYVVLGRREQAADAWRRAKLEHADAEGSTRLDNFAGSLGLAGSAGEEPKDPAAAPPGKAPL